MTETNVQLQGQKALEELVEILGLLFKPSQPSLDNPFSLSPINLETGDLQPFATEAADEFEDSEVDVELESVVIQRRTGVDPESGELQWIDTGFDPEYDSIETVREQYPYETYRLVVVTDESEFGDDLDDPYAVQAADDYQKLLEDNVDLIMELEELKQQILTLKAEVAEHLQALEEGKELLNIALFGRNETAEKLAEINGIVKGLDLDSVPVNELLELFYDLKDGFEELPTIYQENSAQFKAVAVAIGLDGKFSNEPLSEGEQIALDFFADIQQLLADAASGAVDEETEEGYGF